MPTAAVQAGLPAAFSCLKSLLSASLVSVTLALGSLPAIADDGGRPGCFRDSGPICLSQERGCANAPNETFCTACEMARTISSQGLRGDLGTNASCTRQVGYRQIEEHFGRHSGSCCGLLEGDCHCDAATASGGAPCGLVDSYNYFKPKGSEQKFLATTPTNTPPPTAHVGVVPMPSIRSTKVNMPAVPSVPSLKPSQVAPYQPPPPPPASPGEPEPAPSEVLPPDEVLQAQVRDTQMRHQREVMELNQKRLSGQASPEEKAKSAEMMQELLEHQEAENTTLQEQLKDVAVPDEPSQEP